MKISKRVRALAAKLCAIAACDDPTRPYRADVFPRLDGPPSHDLAWDAWDEAAKRTCDDNSRTAAHIWAEAESLLRTGWTP